MAHGHHHHHEGSEISGKNLLLATILNFAITIAEVIGGLLSNSLALLSDALHNLSDSVAVLLAWIANKVSKRKNTEKRTFGYKRIEILTALFNAVVLIVISFFLFYEAYRRFYEPEEIKAGLMLIVAVIGLIANILSVFILKKDSKENLNVKAAYVHLIGDTLSSVAVIIGGILIYFYDIFWLDPLLTILIGLYILKETWSILKETIDILMQTTPAELDLQKVKTEIEQLKEILNIHHVHAWKLTDKEIHFDCHVDLRSDQRLSEIEAIRKNIEELLYYKFGINHITIQFEYENCDSKSLIASK